MRIRDYIGETTKHEKKELLEIRKPDAWLKSISAFANGIGGYLLFGVSDTDQLVGLSNAKKDAAIIRETIKAKMDPVPQIILSIKEEDDKEFILLHVLPGQATPYYIFTDGNRIAYIRIGDESVPANANDLRRLVLKSSNSTFDSLPSPYLFANYSFTELKGFYYKQTQKVFDDSDFLSFGLVMEDGHLTNAGALLADNSPVRYSRLFCTRWHGLNKASGLIEALDDNEYQGSLIYLFRNGQQFIDNHSQTRWKKTSNSRIDMPEYPDRATDEALVNALIHRDYTDPGSEVHIDIFDDRLEIYSPGGMVDGTLVQNLDTDNISSKRRNPLLPISLAVCI